MLEGSHPSAHHYNNIPQRVAGRPLTVAAAAMARVNNNTRSMVDITVGRIAPLSSILCQHLGIDDGQTEINKTMLQDHEMVNLWNDKGQTPLHAACSNGDLALVLMLIQRGADPTLHDQKDGRTALMIATEKGFAHIMRSLLMERKVRATINDQDLMGRTALAFAAMRGNVQAMMALVNAGADPKVAADVIKKKFCASLFIRRPPGVRHDDRDGLKPQTGRRRAAAASSPSR